MATAFLAAKRSKDPITQVGACIVNRKNIIVGVGYNGMPNGCNDDTFPWQKSKDTLYTKHTYVCHAELNAVLNKNCTDLDGCTMYVGLFPCNECAKVIIQSGIKKVIYLSDKHSYKDETIAAKKMFDMAGVNYQPFCPKNKKIVIDFEEIDWNKMQQCDFSPNKDEMDLLENSLKPLQLSEDSNANR
ncbi:deoxycytidylate deaminase isoform X2 [Halyomorpha halys]